MTIFFVTIVHKANAGSRQYFLSVSSWYTPPMVSFQPEMDENSKPERELALVVSGGSGSMLAVSLATAALQSEQVRTLHLIVTGSACKVLGHELGAEWSSARGLRDNLPVKEALRSRVAAYSDNDMAAAIASGSHRLHGVVVLPCSAGLAPVMIELQATDEISGIDEAIDRKTPCSIRFFVLGIVPLSARSRIRR